MPSIYRINKHKVENPEDRYATKQVLYSMERKTKIRIDSNNRRIDKYLKSKNSNPIKIQVKNTYEARIIFKKCKKNNLQSFTLYSKTQQTNYVNTIDIELYSVEESAPWIECTSITKPVRYIICSKKT